MSGHGEVVRKDTATQIMDSIQSAFKFAEARKKAPKGLFFKCLSQSAQSRSPPKMPKQCQQTLEHVDDVQIQGQSGADVVGFAAVHNALEVIQHVGAEHTDGSTEIAIMPAVEPTNTLMMPPTMIASAPTNSHLPMPSQAAFDDRGQAGHHKEHAGSAAKRGHDQLRAIFEAQHHGNHARQASSP
jgi:hypothetical protein